MYKEMSRRGSDNFGKVNSIQWNGRPFYYRVGTSDISVIHSILLKSGKKSEYFIEQDDFKPKVIFDIGGNVGCAAVFFAKKYPDARILSFEPVLANFVILSKNISEYGNITGFNVALGNHNGSIEVIESPDEQNFGGFSVYQRGATDVCKRVTVASKNIGDFIYEEDVVPDLIKVDTEGAEYLIMTSVTEEILMKVKYIIGELHGENDFELLAYLSKWFDIGLRKSINNTLFNFVARRKKT